MIVRIMLAIELLPAGYQLRSTTTYQKWSLQVQRVDMCRSRPASGVISAAGLGHAHARTIACNSTDLRSILRDCLDACTVATRLWETAAVGAMKFHTKLLLPQLLDIRPQVVKKRRFLIYHGRHELHDHTALAGVYCLIATIRPSHLGHQLHAAAGVSSFSV